MKQPNLLTPIVQYIEGLETQADSLTAALGVAQSKIPEAWEQTADAIINGGKALGKFNIPYDFGGDTFAEGGLDCSGFTKLLYDLFAGTSLHRVSGDQAEQGTAVDAANVRKGDLLFFTYSQRNGGKPTHVGIYTGDGKMLHTNNDTLRIHISDVAISETTAIRRMF